MGKGTITSNGVMCRLLSVVKESVSQSHRGCNLNPKTFILHSSFHGSVRKMGFEQHSEKRHLLPYKQLTYKLGSKLVKGNEIHSNLVSSLLDSISRSEVVFLGFP